MNAGISVNGAHTTTYIYLVGMRVCVLAHFNLRWHNGEKEDEEDDEKKNDEEEEEEEKNRA